MEILYLSEPFYSPVTPVLISEEKSAIIYLDDELSPVKCYDSYGNSIRCPETLGLQKDETYVVGGAAAEVLASYMDLPFIDVRRVKIQPTYRPGVFSSFFQSIRDALQDPTQEPIAKNSIVAVFPGAILKKRAWAVAYIGRVRDGKLELKAEIHFDQNFRVLHEKSSGLEELDKFDHWWEAPWDYVFTYGKNLRRLIELVMERPVEKISPGIIGKEKPLTPTEIIEKLFSEASTRGVETSGRRSLKKAVVYIDESIIRPSKGYSGVLIIKNSQRRIFARWYFDEKFQLKGFDNVPPEAVSGIDVELGVGNIPRETQARLSEVLSAFLVKKAMYTPVRIVDYLALKVHRWYEVAAV
ncbi:MAG: hypothetical protein ABWK01_09115 [Infirmifilum sp.]